MRSKYSRTTLWYCASSSRNASWPCGATISAYDTLRLLRTSARTISRERDVLGGQIRRGGDHQRMTDAMGMTRRPGERLHAAQAPAHHRRPAPDAEPIGETRLRIDPILDGHQREIGAIGAAGRGIERQGS